jgi:hypothetical protein
VCRALFQAIELEARAAGVLDLQLQSWFFNEDARRAFERLGFVPKSITFESRLR